MSHRSPYPPIASFDGGPSAPPGDNPYTSNTAPASLDTPSSGPSNPPDGPAYFAPVSRPSSFSQAPQRAYPDIVFSSGGMGATKPAWPSAKYALCMCTDGGGGCNTSTPSLSPSHNATTSPVAPGPSPPHAAAPYATPGAPQPVRYAPGHGPAQVAAHYPTPGAPQHTSALAATPYPMPTSPQRMRASFALPEPMPGAAQQIQAEPAAPNPTPGALQHTPASSATRYPTPGSPQHTPANSAERYPTPRWGICRDAVVGHLSARRHTAPTSAAPHPAPGAPEHTPAYSGSTNPAPGSPQQTQSNSASPYPTPGATQQMQANSAVAYPMTGSPQQLQANAASQYPAPGAPQHTPANSAARYPTPGWRICHDALVGYRPTAQRIQASSTSPYPTPGAPQHTAANSGALYPTPSAPQHTAANSATPYPMPGAPQQMQADSASQYPAPGVPQHTPANCAARYPTPGWNICDSLVRYRPTAQRIQANSASPYPTPGAPQHTPASPASLHPMPGISQQVQADAAALYPTPGCPQQVQADSASRYPAPGAPDGNPASAQSPYPVPGSPTQEPASAAAPCIHPVPGTPEHPPRQHHASLIPNAPNRSGGRKKALLIGCNYPGTHAELRGSYTDVEYVEFLLRDRFCFTDITVLRDDAGANARTLQPTHDNILQQMGALVCSAQPGDSLFFFFSGHGSQEPDPTGDDHDGMNEALCPTDYERCGHITDDCINEHLVNPLPAGVRLHALLDMCHSGTSMDLRYVTDLGKDCDEISWNDEYAHKRVTTKYKGTNGGFAVQFAACKDSQTAEDKESPSGGTHSGVATFLFVRACERLFASKQPLTYSAIMKDVLKPIKQLNKEECSRGPGGSASGGLATAAADATSELAGEHRRRQTPQLSASEPFDLDMEMVL